GPGVGLRPDGLPELLGSLHQLPAPQAGSRRRPPPDPHGARRRLRTARTRRRACRPNHVAVEFDFRFKLGAHVAPVTFRARISLATAVAVGITVAGLAGATFLVLSRSLTRSVDDTLRARATGLFKVAQSGSLDATDEA